MLPGGPNLADAPEIVAEQQRACAVVSRDLPSGVVAVGSPARVVRHLGA